jgi:hypothetical protein
VDPARAHAKLTHARLESLPIPDVEFSSEAQRRIHDDVAARARKLLDGEVPLGGPDDKSIELLLHEHQAWTPRKGMFAPGVDGLDTRIESLSGVERGL